MMPAIDQLDAQVQRDIGALSAEMRALTDRVTSLSTKLDDVHSALERARGGWWAVSALASIAGGLAGFAATVTKISLIGG